MTGVGDFLTLQKEEIHLLSLQDKYDREVPVPDKHNNSTFLQMELKMIFFITVI